MKLDAYLEKHSISDPDFGAMIGRDRTTVMRLRKNKTKPDWETVAKIVEVTSGAVTANDFLSDRPSKADAAA